MIKIDKIPNYGYIYIEADSITLTYNTRIDNGNLYFCFSVIKGKENYLLTDFGRIYIKHNDMFVMEEILQ